MRIVDQTHNLGEVVFTAQQIAKRVTQMAREIDAALEGIDQVLVIGVLKGAAFFTADLARQLNTPTLLSFIRVSSYGWQALDSDGPKVMHDADIKVDGRHVLVAEDIIDSGSTLALLRDRFLSQGALSVRVAVLIDMRHRAEGRSLTPDFIGFESDATWVCGYGIDYKEQYRNLSDIRKVTRPSR